MKINLLHYWVLCRHKKGGMSMRRNQIWDFIYHILNEMYVQDVSVQTERAILIVFAPKKDGTLHFCVNYRNLNAVSIRDSYLIRHMDERLESPGHATTLSILDARNGYWQVEVSKKDCNKTSFSSCKGLLRFI